MIPGTEMRRTIFGDKIWMGVLLSLLNRLKRFNLQETDKILGFRFFCLINKHPVVFTNVLREPMKVSEISRVLFASCSKAQNVGRNAMSSSPYIKTFSNCYFVDISVSFKEKQHHLKFHLTWARGTQFGEDPVLAVHLSESVRPSAQNFRTWQHTYSTAPWSKL